MNKISIASLITALIFISFSYKVNANDIENSSAIPVIHSIPTSITPLYNSYSGETIKYELKVYENKSTKIYDEKKKTGVFDNNSNAINDIDHHTFKFITIKISHNNSLELLTFKESLNPESIPSGNNFLMFVQKLDKEHYQYVLLELPDFHGSSNYYLDNPIKSLFYERRKVIIRKGQSLRIEIRNNGVQRIYILTPKEQS